MDDNHVFIREVFDDYSIELEGNLVPLQIHPMPKENLILFWYGLTSQNNANIVCNKKLINIHLSHKGVVVIHGSRCGRYTSLISVIKANRFVRKIHVSYLAYVIDAEKEKQEPHEVDVARDYPEVLLDDLTSLPSGCQIKFCINLVLDGAPIVCALYRLASLKMKEMMARLQELLDKGFIRPSISPWEAPILFVKKKDGAMRMCIDYVNSNNS